MHANTILAIRIGLAVQAVAQSHHLTSEALLTYLKLLFPGVELSTLEEAALVGAAAVKK